MANFKLKEKKLSNGLQALLLPRTETDTVTLMVLVGVGSRYETPRQNGLSHFLEHMFFKGTEKRPTTKEIAEAVDEVGGEFNAFTSQEYTGYFVKVAAKHRLRAIDVVSDILLRPTFPEEEIERERGVIAEEIRMYTESPMRHVEHLWLEALYGTAPLGRRIDGSVESTGALKRKDFVEYTKEHYHTGNATVVLAGNFDEKKATAELEKYFVELSQGGATKPKTVKQAKPKKKIVFESRPSLDQTHIMVGSLGPSLQDEDKYAADVLAAILGGGMSSRLFLSVRERRGLAYAVRTSSENFTDTGSFVTQAGVRTDKAKEALKVIGEEYDKVIAEPVSEEELKKVKQMIRGRSALSMEETNTLAIFAATQEILEGEVAKPAEILKKIDAVTAKDVQRVAKKYLDKKKRAAAILGPQKSEIQFAKLI